MSEQTSIKVKLSLIEQLLVAGTGVGAIVIILTVAFSWSILPDSVPLRLEESAKPGSGWVSKNVLLLLYPLVILTFFQSWKSVNLPASHFSYPCPVTERNAEALYRIARSATCWFYMQIMWFFVFLLQEQIRIALGEERGIYPALSLASGLMIFVIAGFHSYLAHRVR